MTSTDLDTWRRGARVWLKEHTEPWADTGDSPAGADERSDSVAVFHNLSHAEEAALLDAACCWQQEKFDAGYGAITWPVEWGGAGLASEYAWAYEDEEARFPTPAGTELFDVTVGLVAPTVGMFGTPDQKDRFLRRLFRAEILACQLFSEPGAGSDLAGVACRAAREDEGWVIDGQKVWTSGAQHAAYGELIARTDPTVPKHAGLTAFLVPLDLPGIEIRPIRQMTGGSSFNEVFLSGVRIPQ